jgi:hypothetical protein
MSDLYITAKFNQSLSPKLWILLAIQVAAELHLLFNRLASEVFLFSVCGLTIHW